MTIKMVIISETIVMFLLMMMIMIDDASNGNDPHGAQERWICDKFKVTKKNVHFVLVFAVAGLSAYCKRTGNPSQNAKKKKSPTRHRFESHPLNVPCFNSLSTNHLDFMVGRRKRIPACAMRVRTSVSRSPRFDRIVSLGWLVTERLAS